MKAPGFDLTIADTQWYAYARWRLERMESFPKCQRFILGQRLANQAQNLPETLP